MPKMSTPVPAGRKRRPPLILVVDDDARLVRLVSDLLSAQGYDVLSALDGDQAYLQATCRTPDLALFDLRMPDTDGISLCRRFREAPGLAATPIIFVTGAADETDLVDCFQAGAVDFLSKPIRAAELLQRVRTHLELKFARDRLVLKARDCDVLTAMVAHDLKSPLASIRFSVEMLSDEPKLRGERVQDLLASLTESTDRTLAFIDEFLNLNAAANTVALDSFCPFRVDDVARLVIERHAACALEKCIRIETNPDAALEVFGDPLAAEHVIENLLSNALKFAPSHSRVRVISEPGQPGTVRVRVLDRGPGIAQGDRRHLFQRYVRLSARPTSGESSTGLGLSIAKQLAEAMHGSLAYEDRPGGGSIFTFEMPTRPLS